MKARPLGDEATVEIVGAGPSFNARVDEVLDDIGTMLKTKNAAYGNSALDPLRVFSRADAVEQLKVRIDDKLSRLVRGQDAGEDVERDLIGYLVLLRIARMRVRTGGAGGSGGGSSSIIPGVVR